MSAKPIQRILGNISDQLKPMLERADHLDSLTRELRNILDESIAIHITVANLRDDTIIIAADSPVWATRIRYLAPVMLQFFQSRPGLSRCQKIQFKVLPREDVSQDVPVRTASLSASSAALVRSTAADIKHPDLAQALLRLGRKGPFRR